MRSRHANPRSVRPVLALALLLAAPITSCAARKSNAPVRRASDQPARADSAARNRPPAILNGQSIIWSELTTPLAEAAGALVLEEIILDRMLVDEARRLAVAVTADDIQREENFLLASLVQASVAADEIEGRRLLTGLRERRGLGETRYHALLRRSALLRALVQDRIVLNEDLVRQAFELLHGPRFDVRLIVVDSAPALDAATERLRRGEQFGEVAARFSAHDSAPRGGAIESVSAADPTLPSAIRETLRTLKEGETSGALALPAGFAIVRVESITPADGADFEMVRPEVEEQARRTQERLAMTALANELLTRASVTVFDPALNAAWQIRRR